MMLHSPIFPPRAEFPFYEKTTIEANDEFSAIEKFCRMVPNVIADVIVENPPRSFDFFPEYRSV